MSCGLSHGPASSVLECFTAEVTRCDDSPLLSSDSLSTENSDIDSIERSKPFNEKTSNEKTKKRVTFPSQENLERVLEIPNRAELQEIEALGETFDTTELQKELETVGTSTFQKPQPKVRQTVLRQLGTYPSPLGNNHNNKQSAAICNLARKQAARTKRNHVIKTYNKAQKQLLQTETNGEAVEEEEIHEESLEPNKLSPQNNVPIPQPRKRRHSNRTKRPIPRSTRPNSSPAVLRVGVKRPDLAASSTLLQVRTNDKNARVQNVKVIGSSSRAIPQRTTISQRNCWEDGITRYQRSSASIPQPRRAQSGIVTRRPMMASLPVPTFPRLHSGLFTSKQLDYGYLSGSSNLAQNGINLTTHAFKKIMNPSDSIRHYDIPLGVAPKHNTSSHHIDPESGYHDNLEGTRKYAWQSANGINGNKERCTPSISQLFDDNVTVTELTYM